MDGVKVGTILSRDGWGERILKCDSAKEVEVTQHPIKHMALISGQIIVDARNLNLEPPYLSYSVLRNDVDMYGDSHFTWMHVCFGPSDAGHLLIYAEERVNTAKKKKAEKLKEGEGQRVADLAADLDVDLDNIEDLGTIGLKEAMRAKKDNRLHGEK